MPPILSNLEGSRYRSWINCKIENGIFCGCGGPANLGEILRLYHEIGCFPPRRGTRPSPGQGVLAAALGFNAPKPFSRPERARYCTAIFSCPVGAAECYGRIHSIPRAARPCLLAWRLPWARAYALSGRTFAKSSNFMIHSLFLPYFSNKATLMLHPAL